jgi:hypothetical protein
MFYIVQTGKKFKTRYKNTFKPLIKKNKMSMESTVAEHTIEKQHNFKCLEVDLYIIEFRKKARK